MTRNDWNDFSIFATAQLSTRDIDPAYPVLKATFDAQVLPAETRLWRLLVYLTYYSLSSAEVAWTLAPTTKEYTMLPALPTGIERRGMRNNPQSVNRFLSEALEHANANGGSLSGWAQETLAQGLTFSQERAWFDLREQLACVWGAGPWATYKWADLLKNVMGYPIRANDIGLGGGSSTAGPVPGLSKLLGRPISDVLQISIQHAAYEHALSLGIPFTGMDEFETALCDFNSLIKGAYYVGHDIDMMQESLSEGSVFWAARRASLPHATLGELNGWTGVRRERKTAYRETGVIVL